MTLSKGFRTALVSLAAVTVMGLSAACGTAKKPEVVVPPQTSTIDTIVSQTPAVTETPDEPVRLGTGAFPYELTYEKGDVSWKVNLAYDVETAIFSMTNGNLSKTEGDFRFGGAIVDEKERYVIAWGNIDGTAYGKISFIDTETGKETSKP